MDVLTKMTLRVSATTDARRLASAINGECVAKGGCRLSAIGAGAVNQAIKAVAIARGFAASAGHDLVCRPHFTTELIDGNERTTMVLEVMQ